ncbi:hypothetical protein DFH94DRAFT_710079 [Russula ochroleuca]|uniref:Uncharacterized protein n=1 Tax=Russula ochroleuca TaxID=152965 RepID=A0A9P5N4R3_9AGAM|nr:hypothetical protein DFH94DRAFT_710079 [Russula ochroleuca]
MFEPLLTHRVRTPYRWRRWHRKGRGHQWRDIQAHISSPGECSVAPKCMSCLASPRGNRAKVQWHHQQWLNREWGAAIRLWKLDGAFFMGELGGYSTTVASLARRVWCPQFQQANKQHSLPQGQSNCLCFGNNGVPRLRSPKRVELLCPPENPARLQKIRRKPVVFDSFNGAIVLRPALSMNSAVLGVEDGQTTMPSFTE